MIPAMSHYLRSGTALASRGAARQSGVWEVVGILAAVIPCGILAGLYLATGDLLFLVACCGFAVIATGIVFARNLGRMAPSRWRRSSEEGEVNKAVDATRRKMAEAGGALRRTFTLRILKLLGLVAWLIAWSVLASLYSKIVENANMAMLVILVAFGGLSPIVIYFGLETSVKKLSKRIEHDE